MAKESKIQTKIMRVKYFKHSPLCYSTTTIYTPINEILLIQSHIPIFKNYFMGVLGLNEKMNNHAIFEVMSLKKVHKKMRAKKYQKIILIIHIH